jgi:subtilase family serine protease
MSKPNKSKYFQATLVVAVLAVAFCTEVTRADIMSPLSMASPASAPGAVALATSASAPYTPAQILTAYNMNSVAGNGAGQTIAIVDAYHDPTAFGDLNAFSAEFGLPQFNLAGGSSNTSGLPTFTQISTTAPDNTGGGWNLEEALDIEWAHAMAPMANITLVEATSAVPANLTAAVNTARNLTGVSVVSMSWGQSESSLSTSDRTTLNNTLTTPASKTAANQGVTFIAASGDQGSPGDFPAYSPNVVAVGGTSLTISSSSYARISESAWANSGGGVSKFYSQPTYQANVTTLTGTANRAMPDVSFLADKSTGVYVYDSQPDNGQTSQWWQVGGTSLGAPAWSGIVADADQLRVSNGIGTLDGPSQTLPALYSFSSDDYDDIVSGSNGSYTAVPGYDEVTGLGTPNGEALVSDLTTYGAPEPPTPHLAITAALLCCGIAGIRSRSRKKVLVAAS